MLNHSILCVLEKWNHRFPNIQENSQILSECHVNLWSCLPPTQTRGNRNHLFKFFLSHWLVNAFIPLATINLVRTEQVTMSGSGWDLGLGWRGIAQTIYSLVDTSDLTESWLRCFQNLSTFLKNSILFKGLKETTGTHNCGLSIFANSFFVCVLDRAIYSELSYLSLPNFKESMRQQLRVAVMSWIKETGPSTVKSPTLPDEVPTLHLLGEKSWVFLQEVTLCHSEHLLNILQVVLQAKAFNQ